MMAETVIVHVTQKDIDEGKRNECFNCPLTLAIRRATGKSSYVGSGEWIQVGTINPILSGRLPIEAITFRDNFDKKIIGKPFTFTLSLVTESI